MSLGVRWSLIAQVLRISCFRLFYRVHSCSNVGT